uniref:EMB2369 (EMBRYO DEFECTIVE 2369) n=1 Tax=Arundo donax TaxID=35708 RepID=A0A0A9EIG3_ARUDO
MSLQVLPRNRCTPSIPPVLHVFESLNGPMNISYKRRESAPYSETTSSGLMTFPRLLLIL